MQETWIWFLGQEDHQEKRMVTYSIILSWRIPWSEEPGRVPFMGSQRVRHDWVTDSHKLTEFISKDIIQLSSVQFSQSCPTLCNPMNCSMPGLPVHHQVLEFTQTHVHWVSDTIQPSHPLLPPSPPAFNLSQHQGLFQWVSSSYQVAKVLEFQPQYQSFQWTHRTDLL